MKIGSFATFMHIVIKTTCMMDLFDIPLCGKKNADMIKKYMGENVKKYIYFSDKWK